MLSCAEVAAPPGGEEDTIGPSIIESEPASGAVNVPTGNSVTIYFSERILRPTSGATVSISPRPAKTPKLKWGANKVTVIFPDSFQANRTYTVSLSSSITDLRRKSVEGKSSISFSTGAAIDSGSVTGFIYRKNTPAAKMAVGLFHTASQTAISVDSVYPDYLLYSDKNGLFSFTNLANGMYHLIAFDDRNRNELFDKENEAFALPDRSIQITGLVNSDTLVLTMQEPRPDTLHIVDASVTKNKLIHVRLNRAIPIDSLRLAVSTITLKPVDPQQQTRYAKSFLEQDSAAIASITFDFGPLPTGICTLSIPLAQVDTMTTRKALTIDSMPDTERPRLAKIIPGGTVSHLPDSIVLLFSEPVRFDSTGKPIYVISDVNDTITYQLKQLSATSYKLTTDRIKLNHRYRFLIDTLIVTDRSGNHAIDTGAVSDLRVLPEDSLGQASGIITNQRYPDSLFTVVVNFLSLRGLGQFGTSGTRQFSIDLPSGKYLVSAFVDRDADGHAGLGTLTPFTPAEQYITMKDTVTIRARFETAGIVIPFK